MAINKKNKISAEVRQMVEELYQISRTMCESEYQLRKHIASAVAELNIASYQEAEHNHSLEEIQAMVTAILRAHRRHGEIIITAEEINQQLLVEGIQTESYTRSVFGDGVNFVPASEAEDRFIRHQIYRAIGGCPELYDWHLANLHGHIVFRADLISETLYQKNATTEQVVHFVLQVIWHERRHSCQSLGFKCQGRKMAIEAMKKTSNPEEVDDVYSNIPSEWDADEFGIRMANSYFV